MDLDVKTEKGIPGFFNEQVRGPVWLGVFPGPNTYQNWKMITQILGYYEMGTTIMYKSKKQIKTKPKTKTEEECWLVWIT